MLLDLKANELLKRNIDALLQERKRTRADLARWCRRSRSWLDKIYGEDRREIPLKYLDRIAEFFAFAPYQLFQPGIASGAERRRGSDRRKSRERRLSALSLAAQPQTAVDLMDIIRAISPDGRKRAIPLLADILNDELNELRRRPPTAQSVDAPHRIDGTAPGVRVPAHGGKGRKKG